MFTDRREFLVSSIASTLTSVAAAPARAAAAAVGVTSTITTYGLTEKLDATASAKIYAGTRGATSTDLPYVYLYYDYGKTRFLSPLDVTPDKDIDANKPYTLSSKLHAFNIRRQEQAKFAKLKNDVQLAFNVTAPNPLGDLTWVFMNAIELFAGKKRPDPDQLSTFLKGSTPGATLSSQPKVTITKGTMSLQVMAYGQRQAGFWKSFFDFVTRVIGSPTTATALTGFGIPGLAVDALQFVDHALTELTKNEGLEPLWKTGSLDFGIDPQTKALFKMRPGIWLVIDHDYAADSDLLDGHTLDLTLGSYRIFDKAKKAVDTNYLVADFRFDAA